MQMFFKKYITELTVRWVNCSKRDYTLGNCAAPSRRSQHKREHARKPPLRKALDW